ncbi:hypothetical protein L218DRAFT_892916 [Marasmius fiardii PR-910]|nr:hypothetical protein L218DRAFT_892916 [Marasmius fiardii PR-910]
MMFSLKTPKGYPVGATTFRAPLIAATRIGSVKLKGSEDKGLPLEEVAFTAYYPAQVDSNSRRGLDWITRPLRLAIEGFSRFSGFESPFMLWGILAPLVYIYGRLIKIPVYPDVPLLHPSLKASQTQWPLVIFSHGLGGSRTAYSQVCSRIAASGRVVLAIEHRDGTNPACQTRSWDADGKCTTKPIFYTRQADVSFDEGKEEPLPLRADQLLVRRHEIYYIFHTFSRFLSGDTNARLEVAADCGNFRPEDWTGRNGGEVPVSLKDICLAGHSFGGCTMLSILSSNAPPDFSTLPCTHALIYDPWLEPFPTPGPIPKALPQPAHLNPSQSFSDVPRMLVINSEPFTLWKDHFPQLQTAVHKWGPQAKLITLIRAIHYDFSDFAYLPLLRKKSKALILEHIEGMSLAFLDGTIEEKLKQMKTRTLDIKVVGKRKDGRPKRQIVGEIGDIIIH